jgi:hypothetical protein
VKGAAALHLDGTKELMGSIVKGLKSVNDEVRPPNHPSHHSNPRQHPPKSSIKCK